MIDIDSLRNLYWETSVKAPRSDKFLSTAIRQNNKILIEATDQSTRYISERNKLGASFESLLRSVGLGAGVLLGGPVGAATLSSIAGGVGRGVGEYFGNRIYGKTISELEKIADDYKYRQLINNFAKNQNAATKKLIDEFEKQTNQETGTTINDLAPLPQQ